MCAWTATAATTLGLSSGSRAHSPSPPARTDLRLRATRSWLKELGAQPGVAGVQGDAPAPSADLG